jgi:(p)ppGpp synthase/HD superfamily hydrolase
MTTSTESPLLTDRFEEALQFAARVHARDPRKGTAIPYIAHLLGVCALILTDGGSEDEAIAGLLHDTLEDHPEDVQPDELERRFGPHVRSLVDGCTDTPPGYPGGPKPPWRERKEAYLAHLREAPPDALRVSLADKLDNARAILADYREIGEEVWSRFSAPRGEQLWYYRALVDAFRSAHPPGRLLEPFAECVSELERRATWLTGPDAGKPVDHNRTR